MGQSTFQINVVMEIFYNELSNRPLAANQEGARKRIIGILETMKSLREYDINVMRTHNGFYAEQLSEDYSFGSFFGDTSVSMDLKILLRTIVANPFIEDDESYEAEQFLTNTFTTNNQDNEEVSPEGLASAFVFHSPTISLSSHQHWRKNLLLLHVTKTDDSHTTTQYEILNLYSSECVNQTAFQSWLSYLNPPIELNSEENIYKVFPSVKFQFDNKAIQDIISWFYDDKRYLIRVKELLEDISQNPFKGGKGKTEPLGGTSGKASKRIVKKDRIIYTYTDDKIIIHQCRGHYDDN
ncbi:MAG TPA: Txe/YoeB family addiction module toxin [Ginsengibacter sp.]|nr:Txe/YoeB family addiction module toxin [Chitinophagaceae bacterium]HRP16519.1 Txe/YoeB family addiction module toxin [Ginsengibacter sp.]HRP43601.1 Txe/YoeB family addiction module toxin [Ginsengibacter sp.]